MMMSHDMGQRRARRNHRSILAKLRDRARARRERKRPDRAAAELAEHAARATASHVGTIEPGQGLDGELEAARVRTAEAELVAEAEPPEDSSAPVGALMTAAAQQVGKRLGVGADHPAAVYVASLAAGSRPSQIDGLRRVCKFFESTPAAFDWSSLRYGHVVALRSWLLEHYAPATAEGSLASVRGVLKTMVRLGQMDRATCMDALDVKPVRGSREPAGRSLERKEFEAMFAMLAKRGPVGVRDAAILAILYGGGLRRAEVTKLDLSNLQLSERALKVIGKGNKERSIPLHARVVERIQAWLKIRGAHAGPLFHPLVGPTAKTFRATDRIGYSTVHKMLCGLALRADIDHFSPHDLRRSYAGDMLDSGVDLSTLRNLMGHESVLTTARYDRRGPRAMRKAADDFDMP